MRVAVIAEYYPRRRDPAKGAWAHRQALAARDAGADPTVLALERPLPGAAALRDAARGRPGPAARELRAAAAQPRREAIDGVEVEYVRFVSPPRESSYAGWHRWAARPLARALDRLHARRPLDLVHAHYALPAGGAAAPWAERNGVPLVVSVHGGDLLSPLLAGPAARSTVAAVLATARVTVANSRGMLDRAAALAGGAGRMRVIHPPGEPPPEPPPPRREQPTVATLGAVDPRKRHADVLAALTELPDVRWLVIGDGPELPRLAAQAAELGLSDRVEWTGALPPREAVAQLATCHALALPSVDEAFGVAYTEALACGLPAIGCAGEPGPEEIAALTEAMLLVPPRDPRALAETIRAALAQRDELSRAARAAAEEHFSLEVCGRLTVEAYGEAIAG
ncbi:MAG TPA: glycosyltransferase [Thermoleophilaceae bacterium]|jgi:glycosyltransferase involved in cell wall biosynthesis